MGLAEIHPDDIYKWFMEFAVDSYDWVMIGNVYGMGYHNTNIMRKPYLSTSNYIKKCQIINQMEFGIKCGMQCFINF